MSPFALLMLGLALSMDSTDGLAPKLTDLGQQFEVQRNMILSDLSEGEVYKAISDEHEVLVRDALERMAKTLEGVDDLDSLQPEQRAELLNDQELVNTILTSAELDSRVVCQRRGAVGSHFKTTHCETVAERRRRQEADSAALQRLMRSHLRPPSDG